MIVVHGFGPYFGLPDGSPFVMKTLLQLHLAGLPFQHLATGVAGAPYGKVPYIEDDGTIVADSTLIRRYLEQRYQVDLDRDLDPWQRASAWAIEKMVEEHLYFALVDLRWREDANFAAGPARFFDRLPAAVRPMVRRIARRRMNRAVYLQGTGRLPRARVEQIAATDIDALDALLGDKPFLMGPDPTSVDGSVFGVLASLLVPAFQTQLRTRIEQYPRLMAYVERVRARCFRPPALQSDTSPIASR